MTLIPLPLLIFLIVAAAFASGMTLMSLADGLPFQRWGPAWCIIITVPSLYLGAVLQFVIQGFR